MGYSPWVAKSRTRLKQQHSTVQVSLILTKVFFFFFLKVSRALLSSNKNAKKFNEFAAWIVNTNPSNHVMYI